MDYVIFRDIAVVLIAGKYMGLLARRWKAPQVAGEILAGLLIGPCLLGLVQPSDFLTQMAELGVVLLMFSAGLDSDIDEIIKSGPIALLVAMCGVLLPLAAGTALYITFYGFDGFGSDSFYHPDRHLGIHHRPGPAGIGTSQNTGGDHHPLCRHYR